MKIDFVSDVSCPWCVVGLKSLEAALASVGKEIPVDLHFQPFELNPQMGPEGQDMVEHITQKYGSSPADMERSREGLKARGDALGFHFDFDRRGRIYNTFDAHRLLHWAGIEGRQGELKHTLLNAYFRDGENVGDTDVLVRLAEQAGLPGERAREILSADEFAAETRAQERSFLRNGINAVPAIIINERHLISGGQPPELFERALRQLSAG